MQSDNLSTFKKVLKASSIGKFEVLFSAIFAFLLTSGYLLSTYDALDVVHPGKLSILAYFCGSIVLWGAILLGLLAIKRTYALKDGVRTSKVRFLASLSDKRLWLISSLAIFICYLPVVLLCFSILSPDSWDTIGQLTGKIELNNVHSVIFTAFVGIFIHLGLLFGSLEFGTLLFSVAQTAILALIFAKMIVWMRSEGIGGGAIITAFLFYAILPVNAVAGVIMWNDVLFSGFGLLLLLLLRQLFVERTAFFTNKNIVYFVALAFLFCAWRNNGAYAYALFAILAIAIYRKTFFSIKYLSLLLSPLLLFAVYTIFISFISRPTPISETMNVPIQQIARTVKYHEGSLTNEERRKIGKILPFDQIDKTYDPNLADPVRNSLDPAAFSADKGGYAKLWLELFKDHKKTYVAAYLYNSYGYTYPFHPSSTTTDVIIDNTSPHNADRGYSDSAYKRGTKAAVMNYRDFIMSIVPILHNIGLYTFIMLLGLYVAIIRRRKELTGVFILLASLFLTVIVGPVNGEFRYLYLFVLAAPFIIASVFSGYSFKEGNKKKRYGEANH
jgi:hypothetical protein